MATMENEKAVSKFNPERWPPGDHNEDAWLAVPKHLRLGIEDYFTWHRKQGDFLMAVLRNDFTGAVGRADSVSLLYLKQLVEYLFTCAPAHAWGSPEKVDAWLAAPRLKAIEERIWQRRPQAF